MRRVRRRLRSTKFWATQQAHAAVGVPTIEVEPAGQYGVYLTLPSNRVRLDRTSALFLSDALRRASEED